MNCKNCKQTILQDAIGGWYHPGTMMVECCPQYKRAEPEASSEK